MTESFVTTLDNPYDYWTNFDEWYAFDTEKGYNTCAYLARISVATSEMSETDYTKAVNDAVDEVLRLNITGNYIRTVNGPQKTQDLKDESSSDESEA